MGSPESEGAGMNAQLKPIATDQMNDDRMKELIFESMQIISGETIKLATNAHLKALLEERTNLVAIMAQTKDGLVSAIECLYGHEKEMALAHLRDLQSVIQDSDFLENLDKRWVEKVLHAEVL